MTLLAVGSDARSNTYNYGLGDVIRIVRVDFVNARVTILTFPRDLWVEIPDIADNINGQDHEKLNQSYLYGNPGFGYYEGPGAGPGTSPRFIADSPPQARPAPPDQWSSWRKTLVLLSRPTVVGSPCPG